MKVKVHDPAVVPFADVRLQEHVDMCAGHFLQKREGGGFYR